MIAADFRAKARQALSGRWIMAVLAGLLASLLGGIGSSGPDIELKFSDSGAALYAGEVDIGASLQAINADGLAAWVMASAVGIFTVSIIFAIILFIIGSVVSVGYCEYNLKLIDDRDPQINDLFAHFGRFKTLFAAHFLVGLYTFLWSLLLVIPGIVASYSYALVPYLLAERPELSAGEAILLSKQMMRGNRWRLFCLDFSFIGWMFLCIFTLGIGSLWLTPYQQAAQAAFYRDLVQNYDRYGSIEM